MKKKIIVFMTLISLSVGGAIYASCTYTTSCGTKFIGPNQYYFEDPDDWVLWTLEMNHHICNKGGSVKYRCDY